jgi:hypothetical protein
MNDNIERDSIKWRLLFTTFDLYRLAQRCPTFSLIGQKIEENDLGGQIFLKNIVNLKKF